MKALLQRVKRWFSGSGALWDSFRAAGHSPSPEIGTSGAPELTGHSSRTYHESSKILGYSASLLIPVTGKEGGIGYIACLSKQSRHWSAAEIEFLESIAESLEIAIRQAQLYEQTQKQAIRERLIIKSSIRPVRVWTPRRY
jgi:signal transduction protein with GAF and PtsI domain